MSVFAALSIRLRLMLMVGVGAGFGLLLLVTALMSFSAFRGDIRQVSGDVAAASRALALVSSAQSALQAFWKQLVELEAPELHAVFKDQARIADIRKLARW
jgi:hypothetical protein